MIDLLIHAEFSAARHLDAHPVSVKALNEVASEPA